jgi:imidazolonepropionase-like amidohydrolase
MAMLIRNCTLWDGTGAAPFRGELLLTGQRIDQVQAHPITVPEGTGVIDAQGLWVMPGLVEGHAHLTFCGAAKNTDLGDIPPEEHLLQTMYNARTLLEHGFTSVYSAASAKLRLDVVIRNEINAGRIPGPRMRAAGPEITVTGGLGDENRAHMSRGSFGIVADGCDEITRAVRLCVREGCDNIKINISGDDFVASAKGAMTVMRDDEVRTAVEVAHAFGKKIAAHARASDSVKAAVRHGVDVIYHCEFADAEALDLLESVKDRVFLAPAIGLIWSTLHEAGPWGISHEKAREIGLERVMENAMRTYAELRRRGLRVAIGGDYGFAWVPQGTNARDIEHFIRLFGYSPSEALQCATRVGGQMMGDDIGTLEPGKRADLLIVDGDPLKTPSVLQDAQRLVLIMKDGQVFKDTLATREAQRNGHDRQSSGPGPLHPAASLRPP